MKRFGIIGHPVAHSMSPVLFTAAYQGRYPYDRIEGAVFSESWERFLRGYDGINVTAPFKEDAFRACDALSPEARRIGAVNLVVKAADGSTTGYNSDYDGVRLALEEAGVRPCNALVIGCGGAGKAAAAAALDLGCSLTLVNRSLPRAESLAASLSGESSVRALPMERLKDAIRSADLILYTVPGAMDTCPPEAVAALMEGRGSVLLEANYRDPVFSQVLLPQGCRYISGRRWLMHQAAAGYIRFTGEAPDAEAIARAI